MSSKKHAYGLRIREMQCMKHSGRSRSICRAEIDCEIEGGRKPIAYRRSRRAIVIAVKAHVRGRYSEEIQNVDLFIGAVRWLGVCGNGLDDVCSSNFIRSRRPNGIIRSIESHRVVWGAAPSYVLIIPDYRNDLSVRVWSREDHGVGSGEESIITTVRSGCVVLS